MVACNHSAACKDPVRCAAIDRLDQARSLLGQLRGQPCTVIAADRTLGDIARIIDRVMNDLEA